MRPSIRRRRQFALLATAIAGSASLFSHSASGANATWINLGVNGLWQNNANWNAAFPGTPTAVFTSTDAGTFGTSGSGTIDLGGILNFQSVYFGNTDSAAFSIGDADDTWYLSGAANTTSGGAFINAGVTTSQNISAGTIMVGGANANFNFFNNSTTAGVTLNVSSAIGHTVAGTSTVIVAGLGGQV